MGTSQSSSRPNKDSQGASGNHYQRQHHTQSAASSGHSKYLSRNHSLTALDRHSTSGSSSPHPSTSTYGSGSGSPSSLQKALSRRRSSNKTVEFGQGSSSNNGGHQHHDPQHLPSHQEEGEDDYRYHHGRRYHNTSSLYMLPNDAQEVDRLHLQHYIFKIALDKNIHVPIPANGRVIEFGCGPATWTMDMATEMTAVNFVGVDISPIYPTAIYPRNCNFYNESFLEGVSQPDNSFDVVFQRNVISGLTFDFWQKAMKEAYRILKPGGYYECVESDLTIQNAGPQTHLVFDHLRLSMATRDVDPTLARSVDRLMVAAGFKEVHVKEYMIPVGKWGGKVGELWKQNMFAVLETVKPYLATAARVSEDQVQDIVNSMRKEMDTYNAHQIVYVTYGRKPL